MLYNLGGGLILMAFAIAGLTSPWLVWLYFTDQDAFGHWFTIIAGFNYCAAGLGVFCALIGAVTRGK